ncbi:scopoletin glucosyltransferase-like [Zingiber officinale]|uniref:scopoletin glucosyltransferase-like n=1 Tax=Zingiber officinale TaxID=94328 RepID=UPI001C4D7064|nr:scopoletin glucosyltransferase-like [Zingiber officinale]
MAEAIPNLEVDIVVVPFPNAGHIFPATQLSAHFARRNYRIIPLPDPFRVQAKPVEDALDSLLLAFFARNTSLLCVVVDDMLSGLIDTCLAHSVPAVSLFTSGACAAALDYVSWQLDVDALPDSSAAVPIPGLPDDIALTPADILSIRHKPFGGPARPGGPRRQRGVEGADGAIALLINTCGDLERPFLDYVSKAAGKPAWGVGPLLPDSFWRAAAGSTGEGEVRSGKEFGVDVKELVQWLDAKPTGSVIFISFGSLVAPSGEELAQLAAALDDVNLPFVWVMQPEAEAEAEDAMGQPTESGGRLLLQAEEVAKRRQGMVIRGWAPQLLILGHPAVGGFLSHCGWNSTVEAVARGVPILAWPVRGDQHHNAKLVVSHLKVGCAVRRPVDGLSSATAVTKENLASGIRRLMGDEGIRRRARAFFADGFPESSSSSLDAFLELASSQFRPGFSY